MQSQITPEWIKTQKSMTASMKKLAVALQELDTHYAGIIIAKKAEKVQDGPYRKVLTTLRTDTKMVRKALETNKNTKNEDEVEKCIKMIDDMFSEGSEVYDTHQAIMDPKKSSAYAKAALKTWNDAVKKAKNKMVKKILSMSKTPTLLPALAKAIDGRALAGLHLGDHNGKFNKAYFFLNKELVNVGSETKKVAMALKQAKSTAAKMNKIEI